MDLRFISVPYKEAIEQAKRIAKGDTSSATRSLIVALQDDAPRDLLRAAYLHLNGFDQHPQHLLSGQEYNNSKEWIEALLSTTGEIRIFSELSVFFHKQLTLQEILEERYMFQAKVGDEKFLIRKACDTHNQWHHNLFSEMLRSKDASPLYIIREMRTIKNSNDLAPYLVDERKCVREEATRLLISLRENVE